MARSAVLLSVLFILTLFSCKQEEKVPPPYEPKDALDAYIYGLDQAGLLETALGSRWKAASDSSVNDPLFVPVPYSESFYLPQDKPEALGLRFEAKRGQVVEVLIRAEGGDTGFIFVDLFRVENDSLRQYRHVATADSLQFQLQFEPRQDSEYILRVIPELLTGGRYMITIRNLPMLAFPVSGKDRNAIGSVFGAPREGGRREHHGVDIFARRHTPVIAPVNGRVRRVDTLKLGGNVVWLRDEKGHSLYFAHLQEQWVTEGQRVKTGDTLGTVGNTGNARTTPPHLHFGIYSRGPVDPWNFIVPEDTTLDELKADKELVGKWVRNRLKVSLRDKYGGRFSVIQDLDPNTVLFAEAASGNFLRVRKLDGTTGYVLARVMEPAIEPIRQILLDSTRLAYDTPGNIHSERALRSGERLDVLGRQSNYLFIRLKDGIRLWTPS